MMLLLVLVTLIGLVSCGVKTPKGTESGTAEQEIVAEDEPDAPEKKILTQDLRMWGLYGPVMNFQTMVSRIDGPAPWEGNEDRLYDVFFYRNVQFDSQGHFVNTIDGIFTVKEIAKKDGDTIIETKRHFGNDIFEMSKKWSYYPNGLVKGCVFVGYENYEEYKYFYNEENELVKIENYTSGEGDDYKTITTFSIEDRDEYGNWTKQIAEVTEYIYDYEKDDYVLIDAARPVRHEMYNRTIRYWGQEFSGQYVVINATELRLRFGPSLDDETYKWKDGTNQHPDKGERFPYLGESGDFYKIDYKGQSLWVSKQYTYLETAD